MSFFEYYYNTRLRYFFLSKYSYKNLSQLPKLEKIVLSLNLSQTSLKSLLPLLSALILVSSQKPFLATSRKLPISLKVKTKTGFPVGCKVDLRGREKFFFFEKLLFSVLPRVKDYRTTFRKKVFRISVPNLFSFSEIEKDYEHFPDLPKLSISLVLGITKREEGVDMISAFHIPLQRK